MHGLTIAIMILDILVCIALVTLVVFQEGNSRGLGALSGGSDTFFGRGGARGKDAILKRLTSITAIIFAVLSITLYLLISR